MQPSAIAIWKHGFWRKYRHRGSTDSEITSDPALISGAFSSLLKMTNEVKASRRLLEFAHVTAVGTAITARSCRARTFERLTRDYKSFITVYTLDSSSQNPLRGVARPSQVKNDHAYDNKIEPRFQAKHPTSQMAKVHRYPFE